MNNDKLIELTRRTKERLEFAEGIKRFSDVDYFKGMLEFLGSADLVRGSDELPEIEITDEMVKTTMKYMEAHVLPEFEHANSYTCRKMLEKTLNTTKCKSPPTNKGE
jgi:hypothetical protein